MTKKNSVLVISHERSGTHFAINTIANIMGLNPMAESLPLESAYSGKERVKRMLSDEEYSQLLYLYLEQMAGSNVILKSHHAFEFFAPFWDFLKEHFYIVYAVRDPLDCLCSCYHYFKKCPSHFPHVDVDKFLFDTKPSDYGYDWDYSFYQAENMVERWFNHAFSYYKVKDDLIICDYEQLNLLFDEYAPSLAKKLDVTVESVKRPKIESSISVAPRLGVVGDHVNLFSQADIVDARLMIHKLFEIEEKAC